MPQALTWTPLGRQCPTHWQPARMVLKRLSRQQKAFIVRLNQLLEMGTQEAAEEGLQLLDTVPQAEEFVLDLVTLRSRMLSQLGRHHMAYAVIFDQLFTLESEALWLDRGHMVEEWLRANPSPTDQATSQARDGMCQQLTALCARTSLLAPQLLLVFALSQGHDRPPLEARLLLAEALDPERWRRHYKQMGPWIEHLAGGFFAYIEYLLAQEEKTQAEQYGRHILAFPWESSAQLTPNALHLLCLALLQLEMWREQKRLCERVQQHHKDWAEPSFWLGRQALHAGNEAQATRHFRAALRHGDLGDPQRRSIARGLLSLQQLDDAQQAIEEIDEDESIDTIQLKVLLALYQEDLSTALAHCQTILTKEPENRMAALHKVSILVGQGQLESAEQELMPWCEQTDPVLQLFAFLLLGDIHLQRDQPAQALACFQRLLLPPLRYDQVLDAPWQRGFLLSLGESLERTGDTTHAIARYQEALALQPSEGLINRVLWLLLQQQRYDEAAQLAATADGATSPWNLYARLQLAERDGDWETSLQLLDDIGQDWLIQEGLLRQGLGSLLRASLATRPPWEALYACEPHLELVLQEPSLRTLRQQAVAATQQQFAAMTAKLGQQIKELATLNAARDSLQQEIENSRLREDTFVQILRQHKELRQERRPFHPGTSTLPPWSTAGASHTLDAPQPTWLRQYPTLFAQLPTNAQAIFRSAAMWWDRLTQDPQEDHAPIVLQLARVVESEINRRLIDPLIACALQAGYTLQDFPEAKSTRLLPDKNRLSVGDAAYLLYHTLSEHQPDGSVSHHLNPRSHEKHAAILKLYWEHPQTKSWDNAQRQYIQHQLPLDLQTLARYRNPASHAGTEIPPPLSRQQALPIHALILGTTQTPGILLSLQDNDT